MNHDTIFTTSQLKPRFQFSVSEDPGSVIPDSLPGGRAQSPDWGVLWHPGLHQVNGAANAPYRTPAEPPGLAI